ncbi:hypothetical protein KCP78_07625 [Salmonella enterica subsp. enterica]|nr:hypothetical protein KCP78_07625 [Salmonella enterica subsp. enterica]
MLYVVTLRIMPTRLKNALGTDPRIWRACSFCMMKRAVVTAGPMPAVDS